MSSPRSPDQIDFKPASSADGRYVAFQSPALDIVTNDFGTGLDVFVRDTVGGSNILISVSRNNRAGNGPSYSPLISADGQYVAFRSRASDLVTNAPPGEALYLRDLQAGVTTLIPTSRPVFRADGRLIAATDEIVLKTRFAEPSNTSDDGSFEVYLSNSGGARSNSLTGRFQVYLQDNSARTNQLISRTATGEAGGWCDGAMPVISGDGRYVVFESMDGSLFPNDANQSMDLLPVRSRPNSKWS